MSEREIDKETEEALLLLIEHQDSITEYSEEVKEIFNENFGQLDHRVNKGPLTNGVAATLSIAFEDEDLRSEIANILVWVAGTRIDPITPLRERDASDELLRLLTTLRTRHLNQLADLQDREKQGEKHWRRVHSNWVIRGSTAEPGIDHRISLGNGEDQLITTSLNSNLELINLLIRKHMSATESFGEPAFDAVDPGRIEYLDDLVDELKDQYDIEEET